MSLEMNDARLAILREYHAKINIEGEYEDEIVVRIRFADQKIAKDVYNEIVDVVEE